MGDSSWDSSASGGRRVVVLNPGSGSGDHVPQVRSLADEYGFDVFETSSPGDAISAAERVATDASLVAACGGDGTVNEVVRGLQRADALDETTLGVVPAGTGNNFAEKIGIESIGQAFDVLIGGDRRRIDVGLVTDGDGGINRPFVNSCVCGITAEASSTTSSDEKGRFGTLAYLLNTLRELGEFDPIPMDVWISGESQQTWAGEAVAVLIGNGRRFPTAESAQADMEDGRFDVTILEAEPPLDLVGEEARRWLLEADGDHITRLQAPALDIIVRRTEPPSFSLDGEILTAKDVHVEVQAGVLPICVGGSYEPTPHE